MQKHMQYFALFYNILRHLHFFQYFAILKKCICMYVLGMYVLPPSPPPASGRIGRLLPFVGGTRQQASLEARWTRAPAGL